MQTRHTPLGILLLFMLVPMTVSATDVSTKIIDALGRPVSGVKISIYWLKNISKDHVRRIDLVKLMSDRNGMVKGRYDEKTVPQGESIWVGISKAGYNGYATYTGVEPEYVLKCEFDAADVSRVAKLEGDAQVNELRELLLGDFGMSGINEPVFAHEHKLRPALRALVADPQVGMDAGWLLAFIGNPDDIRLFLDHLPAQKTRFKGRSAYDIASAIFEPTTEKEWAFLRDCAFNNFDNRWADYGAITTLKLIASPKSLEILKEAGEKNKERADDVADAINYIESAPASLADSDLNRAGKKLAGVLRIGKFLGSRPPQFNENTDKALLGLEFVTGGDLFVHTATFHKVEGKWRLRGVRQTEQTMLK